MMSKAILEAYAAVNFTKDEAKSKMGKTVSLSSDYGPFLKGHVGLVVDYHEQSKGVFQVVIRWNQKNGSEPRYDGFSKDRYESLIEE